MLDGGSLAIWDFLCLGGWVGFVCLFVLQVWVYLRKFCGFMIWVVGVGFAFGISRTFSRFAAFWCCWLMWLRVVCGRIWLGFCLVCFAECAWYWCVLGFISEFV